MDMMWRFNNNTLRDEKYTNEDGLLLYFHLMLDNDISLWKWVSNNCLKKALVS